MEGYRGSSSNDSGQPDVSSSSGWTACTVKAEEAQEESVGGGAVPSSSSDPSSCVDEKSPAPKAQERSFTAADSNSSSTTKSFVPCKVCGDKASGYHYGVTSCEGCKGFFRRSIQKKIEYRCLRDEKCLVIRLNRNRCQYCRFKKCLDVGMSRDSVRYGRVPKRTRERMEENQVTQSETEHSIQRMEMEKRESALHALTIPIIESHQNECQYTEFKTRGLIRKPAIFSVNEFNDAQISPDTSGAIENQKLIVWLKFANLLNPSIQRVVEFTKKLPDFKELSQDDQLRLIKLGFFETWALHASRLVGPSDNTITFFDGSYITRQQVEIMFDYEFVLALFNFVTSVNTMDLNDCEIALFSAIVLISPEREGIVEVKTVAQHQDRLIDALKYHVAKNHPGEPNIFPMLMMKLPELKSLGEKHNKHLKWFRENWMHLQNLPPLFAETFDIPLIPT